jgi:hypothetical protein
LASGLVAAFRTGKPTRAGSAASITLTSTQCLPNVARLPPLPPHQRSIPAGGDVIKLVGEHRSADAGSGALEE